ncbi:MAG: AAA family ATPase [Erysipelotrichaceae bacterium]|nr:AAA family ATPase [Erysipelotrichaceae bacterium]
MNKIELKNIFLLNWYGFVNVTIPVDDDLTFITGENESGKSTILDAFKYAFIGDTEFNKSSGAAKRDLKSYTRCLIDPTKGTYARPADKYPTVYTHIALEFNDELNKKDFVLGVVIETSSSNDISSTRYIINNKRIEDLCFTYYEGEKEVPYSARRFCEQYQVKQMQVNDGLEQFMNAVGLRLSKNYRDDYKRKLRNMMTYKAESRIPEFMKRFVLEDKPVDFKKLKDSKKNIDQLNADLSNIQEELSIIDDILDDYSEYERISARLVLDDVKDIYGDILKLEHEISQNEGTERQNTLRIKEIDDKIPEYEKEKSKKFDELTEAKMQLSQMDGQKAISDEEQKKKDLEYALKDLNLKRQQLKNFQEVVNSLLEKQKIAEDQTIDSNILQSLEERVYDDSQKKFAVERLKSKLQEIVQNADNKIGELNYQKNLCDAEISRLQNKLDELNKNQINLDSTRNQTNLISEINREFEKRRINSTAKMAYEFVADIDNEWQNSVEAFLNVHRYAVIVEPEYFDIANDVLDKSNNRYVELVRTKALEERNVEVVEDSVVKKLEVNNDIARKYFEFWLGRIHAVDISDVHNYDSAMSKEGKLSRNMSVTYLDFRRLKEFCLGFNAIKKTKKIVEKDLELEKEKEADLLKQFNSYNDLRSDMTSYLESFKDYDYSSAFKYVDTLSDINKSENRLKELKTALENNSEYMTLCERVDYYEKEHKKLEDRILDLSGERSKKQSDNNYLRNVIESGRREINEKNSQIENIGVNYPTQVKDALEECKLFDYLTIEASKRSYETRSREDRRKRELENSTIPTKQNKYNSKRNPDDYLPVGIEHEAVYRKRKNKLQVDDLDKLQSKMKTQTRKYEQIFKNDFCTRVYQAAKDALSDTRDINKELRNLAFSTRYQFEINMVNDGSDYAKVIKYSEFLEKTASTDSSQMQLGDVSGYSSEEMDEMEEEILEIINRITSKDDNDEEMLNFSDYRNYLQYEITISNEDIPEGKLSRQIGYNSGAATQIPYLLILAASLSMFYNQRENCSRLIFIDEPFEKMSDDNIKKMLEFFKQQNFQVILCAPSNKMDSIGSECNTIVPVLKIRNEKMLIGKVQFNEH